MRVDGVSKGNVQGGIVAQATDSVSKNLRAQIANAQKQLQALAADKDMDMEEKMERRKEIQQQIMDLNQQLRQHELDLRREKQQQVKRPEENQTQAAQKKEENAKSGKAAGLSQSSMEAMVSADRAIGQAKVQGNVVSSMKARKNVLQSEIEHSVRGAALEKKQESVADIEERIEDVTKSQAESLNKAGKELSKAGEEARAERKVQQKRSDEETKTEKAEAESGSFHAGAAEKERTGDETEQKQEEALKEALQNGMPLYRRVDILL